MIFGWGLNEYSVYIELHLWFDHVLRCSFGPIGSHQTWGRVADTTIGWYFAQSVLTSNRDWLLQVLDQAVMVRWCSSPRAWLCSVFHQLRLFKNTCRSQYWYGSWDRFCVIPWKSRVMFIFQINPNFKQMLFLIFEWLNRVVEHYQFIIIFIVRIYNKLNENQRACLFLFLVIWLYKLLGITCRKTSLRNQISKAWKNGQYFFSKRTFLVNGTRILFHTNQSTWWVFSLCVKQFQAYFHLTMVEKIRCQDTFNIASILSLNKLDLMNGVVIITKSGLPPKWELILNFTSSTRPPEVSQFPE